MAAWPGQLAFAINADGVHVLIDFNGHTLGARSQAVALRPAPITVFDQVRIKGFTGTCTMCTRCRHVHHAVISRRRSIVATATWASSRSLVSAALGPRARGPKVRDAEDTTRASRQTAMAGHAALCTESTVEPS